MAKHKLKFKVGDKVRFIKDSFGGRHGLILGETYEIKQTVRESREGSQPADWQEYQLATPDGGGWVPESDIVLVKAKEKCKKQEAGK